MQNPSQPNQPINPPGQSSQPGQTAPQEDMVLLSSWASMAAYDQRAYKLKQDFIARRRQVIFLSLAATCFSSFAALAVAFNIGVPVSKIFAILGIVLATVLTFLRDDVNEFSKTTTWINLRYISEAMRTELYLYRMRTGRYRNIADVDADDLLGETIQKIQDDATKNETGLISVSDTTSVDEQRKLLVEKGEIKPGEIVQKDLDFATYKRIRMDGQKAWYDRKIVDDYALHRRSARASRAVLGIGAVVAAVGLAGSPQFSVVIAITTALSVAITSDSNVNMFGKTYSIFQTATQALGNLNRVWLAKQNNPDMANPDKRITIERDFVQLVEQIAADERESWYRLVVNIQTISDGTIVADSPRNQQKSGDGYNSAMPNPTRTPLSENNEKGDIKG